MLKIKKYFLGFLLIIGVLLIVFFYKNYNKARIICKDCNVVLISIDALRPDHLGYMRYNKNTSPNIDEIALNGIYFTQAIAPSSYTLPSQMSLFSSLYPSVHKVGLKEKLVKLNENATTLAAILKNNNYNTAGFVTLPFMGSYAGFSKGFDLYDDTGAFNATYRNAEHINKPIFNWLNKNKEKNFFLFVHYMEVHTNLLTPDPYFNMFYPNYKGNLTRDMMGDWVLDKLNLSEDDLNYTIAVYDGSINYVDYNVGNLIKKIDELGLSNNTVIVILADHGEELKDHGRIQHGLTLYEEIVRVPLIIKIPNMPPKKIDSQVSTIDISPTILDILGIKIPGQFQGRSLSGIIENKDEDRGIFSEDENHISLRKNGIKIIYNRNTKKVEAYNLKDDPKEKNDISAQIDEKKYINIISDFIQKNEELSKDFKPSIFVNETVKNRLIEMGYV